MRDVIYRRPTLYFNSSFNFHSIFNGYEQRVWFSSSAAIMRKSNRDPTAAKVTWAKLRSRSTPGFSLFLSLLFSLFVLSLRALFIGWIDLRMMDRSFLNEAVTEMEGGRGREKEVSATFFSLERREAPRSLSARVSILTSSTCVDRMFAAGAEYHAIR